MNGTEGNNVKRVGMVRVGLYFSEIQMKKIKSIGKRKGLTTSEIIRRMIDDGLERQKRTRERV